MRVLGKTGREDIATVYLGKTDKGKLVEFVESVQPPIPREEKWVLIVSTSYGCPVGCIFCDAGSWYRGKLSKEELMEQIDYMVKRRYPNRKIPVKKFKIQFARVGEPSLNSDVLKVLEELPRLYDAPGLIVCISTIAPKGKEAFFERLMEIKKQYYPNGRFQLQFSIHTTNEEERNQIIPVQKWSFSEISSYGERFYENGDRKITLNFALGKGFTVEPEILLEYFSPDIFLIKITPVNPTVRAIKNNVESLLKENISRDVQKLTDTLRKIGYRVIISIGELEENKIGSNCGQYIQTALKEKSEIENSYSYKLII